MRNAKQDQRVYKTQKLIRGALCELIYEKSIPKITVRELTERIHINRATFYLHYKDVYDLVETIEKEILEKFNEELDHFVEEPVTGLSALVTELFRFIAKNADIYMALLGPNGDMPFLDKMTNVLKERMTAYWHQSNLNKNFKAFDHYISFNIAGCMGLLKNWLETGLLESPEQMGELAHNIMKYGDGILNI